MDSVLFLSKLQRKTRLTNEKCLYVHKTYFINGSEWLFLNVMILKIFARGRLHEQAEWVIYLLSAENLKNTSKRTNNFHQDVAVKTGSAQLKDYKVSSYDRGHLCPATDIKFNSLAISENCYLFNISLQNASFNRGNVEKP